MASGRALLSVEEVETYYGNIRALNGVNVSVEEGEIVALIGANGAGKSTLMMTIFGSPRARRGAIKFAGQDITQLPTHEIARLRIAQSPEGRRIFPRMTVFENLQIGAEIDGLAHFQEDIERVTTLFPRLKERLQQRGGTLSGGEQQMLAIARALVSRPRLLLVDELSLGLAPQVVAELFGVLRRIADREGTGMVVVEQQVPVALAHADRAVVLVHGRVVLRGDAAELRADRDLLASAYLGGAG